MTQTPEELKDIIKGTIDGLLSFVDSECLPVEQEFREILKNEARLFGDDGRLVPLNCAQTLHGHLACSWRGRPRCSGLCLALRLLMDSPPRLRPAFACPIRQCPADPRDRYERRDAAR